MKRKLMILWEMKGVVNSKQNLISNKFLTMRMKKYIIMSALNKFKYDKVEKLIR